MLLGRDPRAVAVDFQIIEAMSPELRALVHEYGLKVVQSGRASHNSDDPEKVKSYCVRERMKKQAQLEAIACTFDSQALSAGLRSGLGMVKLRTG